MMQICIPALGTRMILTADWTFDLFDEHRNLNVWTAFGFEKLPTYLAANRYHVRREIISEEVTLPVGTILIVDRIYIRKGANEYSSITFHIEDSPDLRFKKKSKKGFLSGMARFWVKLDDANKMNVDILSEICQETEAQRAERKAKEEISRALGMKAKAAGHVRRPYE